MNLTSQNIAFFCGYPTSDAWNLDRRRYEWNHFYLVKTVQSSHRYNLFHAALAQLQFRLTQFGAGVVKFIRLSGNTEHYSITYSNELRDEGAGSLMHVKGSKSAAVRLKLRGEWKYYPLVKNTNNSWRGNSSSGCYMTFTR